MARPKKEELKQIVEDRENPEVEEVEQIIEPKFFIPTGSTMLNLALSDKHAGGYAAGTMVNFIGDSSSGKTLNALTVFAMMANDPRFDDYDFIYDDVEAALSFNIEHLFGKRASKRIKYDVISSTIQDYRTNLFKCLDKNKPFVYILDSFDALTSLEEVERTEKNDGGGSYKTEKPKIASEIFRQSVRRMKELNSLNLIISQTRDNIGFGAMFKPKVRSGGHALKFFATHEIWASMEKQEKSKDLVIGANVCAKVTKNKITGKKREAYYPIYTEIGIDNTTSVCNFLVDKEHWKKEKNTIVADDIGFKGSFKSLVSFVEENNLEKTVDELVEKKWLEIEESVKLNRKPRFE